MSTITDELLLLIAVQGGAVAAAEVGAFEERIAAADVAATKATRKFNLFSGALRQFGAIGAGFVLYNAVKQFASFQRQMEMLHTQTGSTQGEVTRATKAILHMAVSLGTGPNSLALALYHIESTGKRGKIAFDELRTAAEGAQVGQSNLVDTTNALNAVVVGKLVPTVGGFTAAMGQLNSTVGSGDMVMQDLASAYGTGILASMKRVGLQLIDVNAAMATLGDNNIRGTQAANRLRMGLLQVVKPTNAAAAALEAMHMKSKALADDYYKPNGLLVMLKDLHRHLDHLPKTQQNDVLMTLFGRGRMSAGIMTLYDQIGRLQSKYEAISKGAGGFNKDWEATRKTFGFLIDQAKALWQVLEIKVGGALAHGVRWIMKWVDALKHGKMWAKEVAAGLIGVAMAFGGLDLAVAAFGAIVTVIEALPLVALFAAIAFAVFMLIKHFKEVKDAVIDAFHWVVHALTDAWNWINGHWVLLGVILLAPFIAFGSFIAAIPAAIVAFVLVAMAFIHKHWPGLYNILVWPFKEAWTIIKGIANFIVGAFQWVVKEVEKLIDKLAKPFEKIAHFFGGVLHFGGGVLSSVGNFLGLGGSSHPTSSSVTPSSSAPIVILPRGNFVTPNAPAGVHAGQAPLEATIHNYTILNGKMLSHEIVRQGLMAQARRGAGGPTISDAG